MDKHFIHHARRRLFWFFVPLMLIWFAMFAALSHAHAQGITRNTWNVLQFPGKDVGTKVTAAQNACDANTSVPCIIVFDPVLASWPQGTLPAACSNCTWVRWDQGGGTAQTNGVANEAYYPGATLNARAVAACASFGSGKGVVIIPRIEAAGDPSPVPDNCIVEDHRLNSDMNFNNTTGMNTSAFIFRATPLTQSTTTSTRSTVSIIAEEMAGGSNGDGGNKNNEQALGITQVRRTPGQGFSVGIGNRNTNRLGDTGLLQGVVYNGGNTESGGDDGTRLIDIGGYQESTVMTGTVATVNNTSGAVTFSSGANLNLLGGLRFLLNDSSVYSAPSGCSISNVTLTCTGATLSQFCPGGVAPCGTIGTMLSPAVFVEDVDNDNASPALKMIIALAQIASDTQATIYYKSEGVVASGSVPYSYPRAPFSVTGGAKFYYGATIQDGSIIYACTQNSATLCTFNVDAASSVNFHAGNSVEQPIGNALSIGGLKITLAQYLPSPGNVAAGPSGGGVGLFGSSTMPGDTGWSVSGNFRYPFRAINWGLTASNGYTAPDIVLQMAGKGAPNQAFIQMNDTNNNSYERLVQFFNHSGSNVYWSYDRAGSTICLDCFGAGDLKWTSDGTGRMEIGGSNPQSNLQFFQYIAATYAPTYTARQVNYYANPNNNIWMDRIDISAVPVWGVRSAGSGAANTIINNGNKLLFYSDNVTTQTASLDASTGALAVKSLTVNGGAVVGLQGGSVAGCTTGSSAGSTCNVTLTWPVAFSASTYHPVCTGSGITGAPYIAGTGTQTTTTVVVTISNGQGSQAVASGYTTVNCVATP